MAPLRDYVKRMVHDTRGPEFGCSVVVIRNRHEATVRLTGLCRPVVFDHTWRDAVPSHVAALAGELAIGVNAFVMPRPR